MKLGDCFRLGSVGVVVTEMKHVGQEAQRLDSSVVQFLKDEALSFDSEDDVAALAMDESALEESIGSACLVVADEGSTHGGGEGVESMPASPSFKQPSPTDSPSPSPVRLTGMAMGEKFICYMCYETHDTLEDPLVAPCDCRGDTRYLHVQCLQRWYQTSMHSHRAQVIRMTGSGAPACKICGGAYKTSFKKPDGTKASMLEFDSDGPYVCLVVITRHDTNPGLFNTKFRLNFGRNTLRQPDQPDAVPEPVLVGRSSTCGMVLDYRTVSTVHARVFYQVGSLPPPRLCLFSPPPPLPRTHQPLLLSLKA